MAEFEPEHEGALFRFRASGVGPWVFLTVLLLLVFKTCGVSLW